MIALHMNKDYKIGDIVLVKDYYTTQPLTIIGNTKAYWVVLIPKEKKVFPHRLGRIITSELCENCNIDLIYLGQKVWEMGDINIVKLIHRPKISCKICRKI